MKVFHALLICISPLCLAASPAFAAEEIKLPPPAERAVYGEYPLGYQQIIKEFLKERLLDFDSARLEWHSIPTPMKIKPGRKQPTLAGYAVDFSVNARNRFGMYTGKQRYRMLIRNGNVVHVGRPPVAAR